ncbi:16S rRNA (guanine(527)-N(7))-methyltransferase RsmG [Mycoplasmopsis ciconiae]|uniref:Ribosomal RNA small subunit methyltransferase G n=1 Tax=Mycoplasmopsis ciconiae TaxID=561067 RepID=A0ABU7ML35_9BACT|nr:16S rRNA (guanine(527)-N(7))-methyltransferase RsmG [Mycoplasmopsis ciconiae]
MNNKEFTKNLCIKNNWDFQALEKYFNLVSEHNKFINLTGFKDDRLWGEGILESLIFMSQITKDFESASILDIGAGAGFPSIPYAIVNKNFKFTIYEPIQKRVNFLNLVIDELNLNDRVFVYCTRSEDVQQKNIFDIVTARTVASVRALLMSSFHLVKVNGFMRLIKSKNYQDEINEATDIISKLKTEIKTTPMPNYNFEKESYIVEFKKLRSTPKEFPYKWKDIKK